jgi:UTP-glucose-1-phosphate uridylyltransferase
MIDVFEKVGGPVLAVERVPADQVSNYGVVDVDLSVDLGKGVHLVRDLVEKPRREEAPSNLAIIGRYPADAGYFSRPPRNRERQDRRNPADQWATQASSGSAKSTRTKLEGSRHDTGNKLGYLQAVVYFCAQAGGFERTVSCLSAIGEHRAAQARTAPANNYSPRLWPCSWYPSRARRVSTLWSLSTPWT